MRHVPPRLCTVLTDDDGAAASEYAVLVAILIVAIAASLAMFDLGDAYDAVSAKVAQCVAGSC